MLIKIKSVTVNHRPENTNKQSTFFLFSMSVYTVFKTEKKVIVTKVILMRLA